VISDMSANPQVSVFLGTGLTVTVKESAPGNSRAELTLLLTE
jgi:hypothetical protein